MKNKVLLSTVIVAGLFLAGCEDQSSSTQPVAVEKVASLQPLKIGEDVSISSKDANQQKILLGDGWSHTEPWGIWSIKPEALISFNAKNLPNNFKIALTYRAFVSPKHKQQSFEIFNMSGKKLVACDFNLGTTKKVLTIDIDKQKDSNKNGNVILKISMLTAASPKSVGFSNDGRLLGMGLYSIKVLPE
jgi:hypothetical protein